MQQPQAPTAEQQRALETIKAVYDDGYMDINGRRYTFTTFTHKERRKVFAFFTHIKPALDVQDMSFLDSDRFHAVEGVILSHVTFNDSVLSNIGNHWDLYPGDYLLFITTALAVISYPFMPAGSTS